MNTKGLIPFNSKVQTNIKVFTSKLQYMGDTTVKE